MLDMEAAARVADQAGNALERNGWRRSTKFGTRPGEFWTEADDPPGLTKVWIQATGYPGDVKARYYFADADERDRAIDAVRANSEGTLLATAKLEPDKSSGRDSRCRFYFDAVVHCTEVTPPPGPAALGEALANPPIQ